MGKKFTFYRRWWDYLSEFDDDIKLASYDAVFAYIFEHTEPDNGIVKAITKPIFSEIDKEEEKTEALRQKRSEAGKKHKGNQHTKTKNDKKWNKCSKNGTSVPKMEQNGTSVPNLEKKETTNTKDSIENWNKCSKNGTSVPKTNESEEKNKTKKEEIPPHPPIEEKNKTKKEETNYNACEKKKSDREKNEKSLRERQAAFASAVQAHAENYDEAMLRDFIDYWTEPNKSYSKMRFEQERTWELKRRLDYWERRSKQFKRISYGTTNSNGYIAPELRATQERREQEERLAVRIRQLAEEDGGGM